MPTALPIADKATVDIINANVNTINTNVGSNSDSASATGSVHAKLKDIRSNLDSGSIPAIKASSVVRLQSSIVSSPIPSGYPVSYESRTVKSFAVKGFGTCRIILDVQHISTSYTTELGIYVNKVKIVSIPKEDITTTYKTFTIDIQVPHGLSVIDILSDISSGTYPIHEVRNAKICFDTTESGVLKE